MKNVNFGIILVVVFFSICFCSAFWIRSETFQTIANFDVNKQHYIVHEENRDYNYCPYCGEKLEKEEYNK